MVEPALTKPLAIRLGIATRRTLSDPRLLWVLVAVFGIRRVLAEIPVFVPEGADVYGFLQVGHQALTHPGSIYPDAAAEISHGFFFVTLSPPPQLLLAALPKMLSIMAANASMAWSKPSRLILGATYFDQAA